MKIKFPAGIKSVLIASLIISSLAVSCENPWMIRIIDKYFNDRTEDSPTDGFDDPVTEGDYQPEDSTTDGFDDTVTEGDYQPEDSTNDGFDDTATEGDYQPEDSPNAGLSNPTAADFNVSGTGTVIYDGYAKIVYVTAKQGKSAGEITVWYEGNGGTVYTKSTAAPLAVGKYDVTFDVGAAAGWNAAYGLDAGALNIVSNTVNSISDLSSLLSSLDTNTADTAYTIVLKGITDEDILSLKPMLDSANDKYVILDLSGSNIDNIPNASFCDTTTATGCATLIGLIIPDSVKSIGNNVFYNCSNFTSINIPDGVTSIGSGAFYGCRKITSINIPNSVTSIGDSAFTSCIGLTSVTIPYGVTSIGFQTFGYCASLISVTIPDSVISIGQTAFSHCTSLNSVTIPNNVTSIGQHAFSYCSSFTEITIPASVNSIGGWAFEGCVSLTSVTFQGTILSSGFGATNSFPGDLREKFYATDAANGTPGTYTRESGGTVWTKSD